MNNNLISQIVNSNNSACTSIAQCNHRQAAMTLRSAYKNLSMLSDRKPNEEPMHRISPPLFHHGIEKTILHQSIFSRRSAETSANISRTKNSDFINCRRHDTSSSTRYATNSNTISSFELPRKIAFTLPRSIITSGNEFEFFNRAFVVNLPKANNDHSSSRNNDGESKDESTQNVIIDIEKIIPVIILFNLALCYHREGIMLGNPKAYKTALRMYYKAFSLLKRDLPTSIQLHGVKEKNSIIFLMLMLAIWNNMGYIYCTFFERKDSQKCSRCMKRIIQEIKRWWSAASLSSSNCIARSLSHSKDEYQLFSFFCEHLLFSPKDHCIFAQAA